MKARNAPLISKESLLPFLIYNKPVTYNDVVLHPVTMNDIVLFEIISKSVTVRKNSIFRDKKIIKMSYLDFLFYSFGNRELEAEYKIPELSQYLFYFIRLLGLCCPDAQVSLGEHDRRLYLNQTMITPDIADDLRRIIIIQNGIDFDVDEFINSDTEQRLQKDEKARHKADERAGLEDYIDSLVIAMNTTEERIMHMTIRKFWRYVKRYQLHEGYTIAKTGECSGMVSFREPIRHWMTSLDEDDRYGHLKTDEEILKSKIG